jgi:ABC-type phosphate transport system auxiliary subunit
VTAASPADWAAAGSLGLSAIGLIALALAFADADLAYFDPRRLLDTDLGGRLLVEIARAKHTVRDASRDAAVSAAALLMLLTAAPESAR